MSLLNKQILIAPCCAGMLLDLNESTIRKVSGRNGRFNVSEKRQASAFHSRRSCFAQSGMDK